MDQERGPFCIIEYEISGFLTSKMDDVNRKLAKEVDLMYIEVNQIYRQVTINVGNFDIVHNNLVIVYNG